MVEWAGLQGSDSSFQNPLSFRHSVETECFLVRTGMRVELFFVVGIWVNLEVFIHEIHGCLTRQHHLHCPRGNRTQRRQFLDARKDDVVGHFHFVHALPQCIADDTACIGWFHVEEHRVLKRIGFKVARDGGFGSFRALSEEDKAGFQGHGEY